MHISQVVIALVAALSLGLTCAESAGAPTALVPEPEQFRLELGTFDDAMPDAAQSEGEWHAEFIVWLWFMGLDGDIGARGLVKNVSADFVDVLEATDSMMGISGRVNVGRDRWTGFIDGMYSSMSVEEITITGPDIRPDVNINIGPGPFDPDVDLNLGLLPTEIDLTLQMTIIDFGLSYEIAEWSMGETFDTSRNLTLDVYGGARFTHGELEIDPARFDSVTEQSDWIDPIIGAKTLIPFTDNLDFQVWGDVGGFGAASDLTWAATAVIGYRFELFNLQSVVFAGYRGLGYDYSGDRLDLDIVMHGPLLGFGVTF